MLKGIAKLVGGIIVCGTGVLVALLGVGLAGDGGEEMFTGSGEATAPAPTDSGFKKAS